jgi:hypothetical protein
MFNGTKGGKMENKNFACRIFKEQIELILQLPENERAEVLYKSVLFGFNQIDYQFDNQNENQNESAYVSVSDSVSILSNKIFNLLKKNITWKEFSNNYGGSRKGAGAPKGNTNAKKNNQIDYQNDIQIDNQNEKPKSKFNENSIIYVNGQYFDEFPPESIPLLKKYWTDEKIERIRKDITCKPDHETTISKLLLTYPSDQIDIDVEFEKFWNAYTPVKTTDGRAVNKGSRKETFVKYSRIIKSGVKPADILKGLNAYLTDCRNNNRFTCGATVFLNQERWKDDYNTTTIIAQQPQPTMPHMSLKDMKEMQKMAEIQKILNGEQ